MQITRTGLTMDVSMLCILCCSPYMVYSHTWNKLPQNTVPNYGAQVTVPYSHNYLNNTIQRSVQDTVTK